VLGPAEQTKELPCLVATMHSVLNDPLLHKALCVVPAINSLAARRRQSDNALPQPSRDLGADALTTFRLIAFPMLRSAPPRRS
jgi:ABC-type spermidine/putrescine transport system permease subunit II